MPLPPDVPPNFAMDPGVEDPRPDGQPPHINPPAPGKADLPVPIESGLIDVSKRTKLTLGKYLSDTTLGTTSPSSKNVFPIDPPGSSPTEVSLLTPDGSPAGLNGAESTNKSVFKNSGDLARYPYTEYSEQYPDNIKGKLSKGRVAAGNSLPDGHKLLPGITPNGPGVPDPKSSPTPNGVVKPYVSAMMSNNRFYSTQRYTDSAIGPDGELAYLSYTHDKNLDGDATPLGDSARHEHKTVGFDALSKVGKTITIRGSGEIGSNAQNYNPDKSLTALLPGVAQLAVTRLDSVDLQARDVLQAIIQDDINTRHDSGPNSPTFGNLNNVLEPFGGIAPLGMIALAVALILATQIILGLLTLLLGLITNKGSVRLDATGVGVPGQYRFSPADTSTFGGLSLGGISNLSTLLGLHETINPYSDCVSKGLTIFFRGDPDAGGSTASQALQASIQSTLGGTFKAATESPGFYTVFVRAIVRSTTGLTRQLSSIGSNPISVAQGIVGFVDALRSSKLISALNLFAGLGDQYMIEAQGPREYHQDSIPDNAPAVYKSRLTHGPKLAWGSQRARSLYLLPQNTIKAAAVSRDLSTANLLSMGAHDPGIGPSKVQIVDGNRIDADIVRQMEQALESEYVPFYFHDLRTNEIISFHAFLTSLSDEFTVNHETVEPFGRVDPIKIYKNTSRRISLSFKAAATSPDDFDDMWLKINKLTTMLYPQWSAGDIKPGDPQFIQPFSQIITSSPVIRVRLGDLIASNFSKFALARLFGAGLKNNFAKKDILINQPEANLAIINRTITAAFGKISANDARPASEEITSLKSLQNDNVIDVELVPGMYPFSNGQGAGSISLPTPPIPGLSSNSSGGMADTTRFGILHVKILRAVAGGIEIDVAGDPRFTTNNPEAPKKLIVPFAALNITPLGNTGAQDESGNVDATLTNFMSDDNVIVKSFKSSSGKGLACVIESCSFQWLDNTTWETSRLGSRAPKMCEINMSISPIHDIAPGLDSDGFNRAPIYNVGRIVNNVVGIDNVEKSAIAKIETNQNPGNSGKS
jgi:hypothetical protein